MRKPAVLLASLAVLLASLAVLLAPIAPRADATGFTGGTCVLTVTFSFGANPVTTTLANHSYSFSFGNGLNGASVKPCAAEGRDLNDLPRSQSGSGNGSGPWSCELVENAQGPATQTWTDSTGTLDPPVFDGTATISGTWGAWTMNLTSGLSFQGVIQLTLNPAFSSETSNCESGGTSMIHMIGLEVFEDPQL